MYKSKEQLKKTLNHKQPDKIVIDFGSNAVTGIHVLVIEKLRKYYGLEKRLVKVIEPYQMLNLTSLAFGGFLGHQKPVSLRHLII